MLKKTYLGCFDKIIPCSLCIMRQFEVPASRRTFTPFWTLVIDLQTEYDYYYDAHAWREKPGQTGLIPPHLNMIA